MSQIFQSHDVNRGDASWLTSASTLVMIMTPGLGFFYGGLVKSQNLLVTISMSYVTIALVTIVWYLFGFSFVFGPSIGDAGILGNFDYAAMDNVGFTPSPIYDYKIPFNLYFFYQLMFAAITPAIISGSISNRVQFKSYIYFVLLWSLFVYCPVAHWIWNVEGWGYKLGIIDFAGGIVVHTTSGLSALAAALVTGKRMDTSHSKPCNVPYVLLGTALLWFGWFGFNGGSAGVADGLSTNACIVTNLSGAVAGLTWLALEDIFEKKISVVGFAVGLIVGLGAATPGSGYVTPWAGMVIGASASLVVYGAVHLQNKYNHYDDSLDVFCCHGLSGVWGTIATGFFATRGINGAGDDGIFYGGFNLLWKQIVGVVVAGAWSFGLTCVILLTIKKFVGLRVPHEHEKEGLDKHVFGFDLRDLTDPSGPHIRGSSFISKAEHIPLITSLAPVDESVNESETKTQIL